jgi:DNA polymerase III delta prime subunit
MYSLTFNLNSINFENIIYSKIESRPSKTFINLEIYKYFSKLKINELIIYDIYNLENNTKDISYFLLNEIINRLKLDNIEDFCFSFDNLNINQYGSYNIIFAFEKKISQLSIIKNYINILEEIENNDIVIFNFHNLYYYSNIELMLIFVSCFEKFYIYFSKIIKNDIIVCKNFKKINIENIKKLLNNIYNNLNKNIFIKQIGFNINNDIIKYIKNYNNNYMSYYINLNYKISKLNLLQIDNNIYELYYIDKFIKKKCNNDCNHKFLNFHLEECLICNKCYQLFKIY